MKITRIKIRNLFGISETDLDGRSMEITGGNGAGKSSVLDAIRYALTNGSGRDYVLKAGESEGEILIETDTGLRLDRKKRSQQADYKSVKDAGREVNGPEAFLRTLFTPFQIDPVAFIGLSKQEQNRAILNLIEFDWDMNWIRAQFGEIPDGVDYGQNILEVLNDIQSENGEYFKDRQEINRQMRNQRAFVEEIASSIPAGYDAEKWAAYDMGAAYRKLEAIRADNNRIERAKAFRASRDSKLRQLEAQRDIDKTAAEREIAAEKNRLTADIERLKAELRAAEEKLGGLGDTLKSKMDLIDARHDTAVAKLDSDMAVADEYADKEPTDATALSSEVETAEKMRAHLNEYQRMRRMQEEVDDLKAESDELTRKIELARSLPGDILRTATIPVSGLTVENGVPLINGLPVSNLSDGEKLALCVDVTLARPGGLQIILIDGAERLSEKNREALYEKCRASGLQFIATRTTDSPDMEVRYL